MYIPVLLDKVIEYLRPRPGKNFIDCTLGQAGHARAILEQTKPDGKVLGIDADFDSLKRLKEYKGLIIAHGNFKDLEKIVQKNNFKPINGILFDLGLSSWQIDESEKGFTFKKDEPLNMILNSSQEVNAQEILNTWPEESLIEIFQKYGEEKFSRRIVRQIVSYRRLSPIRTTFQLKEAIRRAVPISEKGRGRLNRVCARIFQSLRIVINDELENLKQALEQSLEIINPKARIVVISFHSLEDRIVKRFFKEKELQGKIKILTKKPLIADEIEMNLNPRSRSAKLRAAQKI
ncbi:16S rRNA (cytosine(1402)-N(4))-methyltransferase RsmH [Patescibacteria group bacterium]|nr:16S rRNA (cytosine(1402)-N(4))-methyltransferase RsmH [Patescibacteria group bacterium]